MYRITRHALAGIVAGAAAGALALGMTPPVVAAPHAAAAKAGHVAVAKPLKAAHGKSAAARASKAARRVALAKRRLSHEAARKSTYLGRVLVRVTYTGLEADVQDAVRGNVENDRAALAAFKETVALAAPSELADLRSDLRRVRPEVYNSILAQLKVASVLKAEAVRVDAPDAVDLLGRLETTVSAYTARTTRAQLRVSREWLTTAAALVEAAGTPLDEPVQEPVPDAPTT